MARGDPALVDILVLGEHPSAYLAAALLRQKPSLKVLHSVVPRPAALDRLVLINPAFFDLHPLLQPLRRKLDLHSLYGLQFLSDDAATQSEHRSKSVLAHVAHYKDVRTAMTHVAEEEGVKLVKPESVQIVRLDETGLDVDIDGSIIRAKALILCDEVSQPQSRMLGLPESWEREVIYRYCHARLKRGCHPELGSRPVAPMSLDLKQTLGWGWLLPHGEQAQVSISQPRDGAELANPKDLMKHWIEILRKHGVLTGGGELPIEEIHCVELPLAGAMAHEGVANRTLLVGPAGGFYSACAEDIYPNCWSALFAVDAIRKALKEPHLQDALQLYRHKWRTTLGDYLRGPQQNLRFLLPLVYRNQVMTTRLTESILQGKSVVR